MLDVFNVQKGFFLDVGAHHPYNLSNTALLYSEGWRGINIDACPGSMAEFHHHRPEDINLEVPIAPRAERLLFTRFNDPGLNGFLTPKQIITHQKRGVQVVDQLELDCLPLHEILDKHAHGKKIDIMSIDVEGMDQRILESMNLSKWRPTAIITEILGCHSVEDVQQTPVHRYLRSNKYMLYSRLHFSCIYIDRIAYKMAQLRRNPPKTRWGRLKSRIQLKMLRTF